MTLPATFKHKSQMVGTSDPLSFTCSCPAQTTQDGVILLFYRYFAAPPKLRNESSVDVQDLEQFHSDLCQRLNLKGKIRLAREGFNITVGGTKDDIQSYIAECLQHWSFGGLDLSTPAKQDDYFKPSSGGCSCAFDSLNIRVTSEITPLGITNYSPANWDIVKGLPPAEFHRRCHGSSNKVLIDVRNHYESRIGFFVDPVTDTKAVTPEVRRFSQFPKYFQSHLPELEELSSQADILTYCTGGIRCEKSVRWMAEKMQAQPSRNIYTLKGGIAAYLLWMDEEIKTGRKTPEDSLFHGKNYVFDGRGLTGLCDSSGLEPVSICHVCNTCSDRLSKCRSSNCHLVLVVCESCEAKADPRCCEDCMRLDMMPMGSTRRPMCACEQQREARLKAGHRIVSQHAEPAVTAVGCSRTPD